LSPFAAAVTYGVHWLAAEQVRGGTALAGDLNTVFALLTARTVTGPIHDTFRPQAPAAARGPGQATVPSNRAAGPRERPGWHGA
jgi:hypothetical protein